jgi:hypothetical protein
MPSPSNDVKNIGLPASTLKNVASTELQDQRDHQALEAGVFAKSSLGYG